VRRLNDYYRSKYALSYLATAGGLEVDLILSRALGEPVFIEIKASEEVTKEQLAHLRSLQREFSSYRYLCLCRESHPRVPEGIEVMPWREGLFRLFPEMLRRDIED
jgi:hypothetical protein